MTEKLGEEPCVGFMYIARGTRTSTRPSPGQPWDDFVSLRFYSELQVHIVLLLQAYRC